MRSLPRLFIVASIALISFPSYADGLTDLKAALARLPGQTPVKVSVDVKTSNRDGGGNDQEITTGSATILIEDNPQGLHLSYGRDLIAKLDAEEHAKEQNSKAKTPTLAATEELSSTEAQHMLNAASSLSRSLEKAIFKAERVDTWNGKPARLLSFDYGQDKISEKDRKYVKKFDATLYIWIAADGTPLASRNSVKVSGSAMIVISFESDNEENLSYAQIGDRLITTRKETKTSGSGMGEKMEGSTVKTVQIVS